MAKSKLPGRRVVGNGKRHQRYPKVCLTTQLPAPGTIPSIAGGLRCLLFQDWCIAPGLSYDTARSPPVAAAAAGSAPAAAASNSSSGPAPGRAGLASLVGQRVRYQLAIKKNPQVGCSAEEGREGRGGGG